MRKSVAYAMLLAAALGLAACDSSKDDKAAKTAPQASPPATEEKAPEPEKPMMTPAPEAPAAPAPAAPEGGHQ